MRSSSAGVRATPKSGLWSKILPRPVGGEGGGGEILAGAGSDDGLTVAGCWKSWGNCLRAERTAESRRKIISFQDR